MSTVYELVGVERSFRQGDSQILALDRVSLKVKEGELLVVAGPSGSGKTTLLTIMSFLDEEYGGELLFFSHRARELSRATRAMWRLCHLGLVFQRFHLLSSLDALENVALPHWRLHGNRGCARARAQTLLERFGLSARLSHPVTRLSGGEMQRVGLARALVNDPAILLADEPTGQLSAQDSAAIISLLQEIHREGRTVIAVSHDPDLIGAASRVVSIRHGKNADGER